MNLPLKNETISLKEFVLSDKTQAIVITAHPTNGAYSHYLFVIKIRDCNNTETIYLSNMYHLDKKQALVEQSFKEFSPLLSVNHDAKYVIAEDSYYADIPKELAELSEYRFVTPNDVIEEMKDVYSKEYFVFLEENLPRLRKTFDYKSAYESCDEQKYRDGIRKDYLRGNNSLLSYKNNTLSTNRYHENEFRFHHDNLNFIHKYLSTPGFIENLAGNNFDGDYELQNLAQVDFNNRLVNEMFSAPDEFMKLSRRIRNSIEEAGKTLTLKLKSGEIKKVNNNFSDGDDFPTVVGYDYIKIEDIDEISFGRNTLFKA